MNFEEFVKNNPAEATTAAQCKSIEEFKKLADDHGLKFEDEKTAEEAFKYVKEKCSNAELDEDALLNVAGGKGSPKTKDGPKLIDRHWCDTSFDYNKVYNIDIKN